MKIEMYMLCLLKFEDDKIVFTKAELNSIKDALAEGLQEQKLFIGDEKNRESSDGWEVYHLNPNEVQNRLRKDISTTSAKIGYYHHRVMAYFTLDFAGDFSVLREVREQLKQVVNDMIKCSVKEKINDLEIRREARVEFFYTYPFIVVEKYPKRPEAFPFSEETGSLCFDIVEPC